VLIEVRNCTFSSDPSNPLASRFFRVLGCTGRLVAVDSKYRSARCTTAPDSGRIHVEAGAGSQGHSGRARVRISECGLFFDPASHHFKAVDHDIPDAFDLFAQSFTKQFSSHRATAAPPARGRRSRRGEPRARRVPMPSARPSPPATLPATRREPAANCSRYWT